MTPVSQLRHRGSQSRGKVAGLCRCPRRHAPGPPRSPQCLAGWSRSPTDTGGHDGPCVVAGGVEMSFNFWGELLEGSEGIALSESVLK